MPVIIGMDPHKRSATIEMINEVGAVIETGKFGTDQPGYAGMLAAGRRFTERLWAAEGCNGVGRHIAHRLVHDGETVLDVPAKLSAQVRVLATGNGRKTDPVDAHSVALAAMRGSIGRSVTVAAWVRWPRGSETPSGVWPATSSRVSNKGARSGVSRRVGPAGRTCIGSTGSVVRSQRGPEGSAVPATV
jgi:hypothetical protein